jgi:tetratricopeptide (TPR) repeat protein
MVRLGVMAGLALFVGACAPTQQDRLREYNEDGVRLFQRGRYSDARDSFQAAVALRPEDPDLIFNLGQCYDRLGQVEKAQKCYEGCIQRVPTHVEARHALTVLLWNNGQQQAATSRVEEWLAREPERAAAYAEQAYLYRRAGDLPRAQSRLQQALSLDMNDVRSLTEMALVYEALNRPDRALALYQRSLEINPRQPDVIQRVSLLKGQGVGPPRRD